MVVPQVSVFAIPSPASDDHVNLYSVVRLRSLKSNPESFGSNFKRESEFTKDQWRERAGSVGKASFIAHFQGQSIEGSASSAPEDRSIGCVTILGPEFLKNVATIEVPSTLVRPPQSAYCVVGTWVDLEFRKLGVGSQLLKAAISWAQNDGTDTYEKVVLLRVHRWNNGAQALYQSVGFNFCDDVADGEPDDQEMWMTLNIQRLG